MTEQLANLSAQTQHRARILVVDDEAAVLNAISICLSMDYDVRCANSVRAALDIIREEHLSLVIMDIMMPGETGFDGLQAIRERNKDVPIVMLTAYPSMESVTQALRLGATDYLCKPFEFDDLRQLADRYTSNPSLRDNSINSTMDAPWMSLEATDNDELRELVRLCDEYMHDVANILTPVNWYLEQLDGCHATLEQHVTDLDMLGKTSRYLLSVQQQVGRCVELIDSFRRLRSGQDRIECFSLSDLIREAVNLIQLRFVKPTQNISIDMAIAPCHLDGDRLQLFRAFYNILVNAVQAVSERDGRIWVSTQERHDAPSLEVRISDNGPGISEEVAERIFEPRFTTKSDLGGSGLGLAITHSVVTKHSGDISVRNRDGGGTTFIIRLPATPTTFPGHGTDNDG